MAGPGRTMPTIAMASSTTSSTASRSSSTAASASRCGTACRRSMPRTCRTCRSISEPRPSSSRNGSRASHRPATSTPRACGPSSGGSNRDGRRGEARRNGCARERATKIFPRHLWAGDSGGGVCARQRAESQGRRPDCRLFFTHDMGVVEYQGLLGALPRADPSPCPLPQGEGECLTAIATMTRFIARRLVETLVVLFVMSICIYGLIGLMPGDPIDLMLTADPKLTAADVARLKALQGLDQPLIHRYFHWLAAALQGDFGYSRLQSLPVWQVVPPRLWNTVLLMGLSLIIALAIAIPAGVQAAARPGSLADNIINLFAFAGISVPQFWLSILLVMAFSVHLRLLPASGMATVGAHSLADRALYLILPILSLTIVTIGSQLRYVRSAMIEVLRQDYIRTARAKGASRLRLLYSHALRNAMIPLVTILALDFGTLFSSSLISEQMFAYLGMGKTIYNASMGNDYNLAMVSLLLGTAVVLLSNLAADLAYAWLDPRINYR